MKRTTSLICGWILWSAIVQGLVLQRVGRGAHRLREDGNCSRGLEISKSERPKEALPFLNRCSQVLINRNDPASIPTRWRLVEAFVRLERFKEATAILEALTDKSQETRRQKVLGLCYAKTSRIEEAIEAFRRVISLDPDDPEARFNLGVLLSQRKEVDQGLTELGQAVLLEPNSSTYSFALAEALIEAKRYAVAAEFLKAVNDKFSGYAHYHYIRGYAHYGMKDPTSAIESFETAVKLDPRMESGFYFLGNAYSFADNYEKAAEAYRKAIALNPNHAPYYVLLAFTEERRGNPEEQIAYLKQAVRLDPGDVISMVSMAKALHKMRRVPEAIQYLRSAIAAASNFKEAYYLLASYSRQIGHTKAADAYIQSYRQLAGEPNER